MMGMGTLAKKNSHALLKIQNLVISLIKQKQSLKQFALRKVEIIQGGLLELKSEIRVVHGNCRG